MNFEWKINVKLDCMNTIYSLLQSHETIPLTQGPNLNSFQILKIKKFIIVNCLQIIAAEAYTVFSGHWILDSFANLLTIIQIWLVRSTECWVRERLVIVERAEVLVTVVDKILPAVGRASGDEQDLAIICIGHRGRAEDHLASVGAVLVLETGAGVDVLLVAG
jgi:hypothetical protein